MAKKKTIACDRCGARIDHIPEKCPECGEIIYDRMDPHVRERILEKMEKQSLVKPVLIPLGVTLLFMICTVIAMHIDSRTGYPSGPSSGIGTPSAVRSAQGMYQSKYNTYGTFGDLYDAGFLQESTFNVGNASAYKYGYTYTITVISSRQ